MENTTKKTNGLTNKTRFPSKLRPTPENLAGNSTPQYMGRTLDFSRLFSKDVLLQYLEENGASDRILADIREKYESEFGNELMWRYPLSDGMHAGTFIVPVQEGFLSLPYDEMDAEDYELLILKDACLMGEDTLAFLQQDTKSYTDAFCNAMEDAVNILRLHKQNKDHPHQCVGS